MRTGARDRTPYARDGRTGSHWDPWLEVFLSVFRNTKRFMTRCTYLSTYTAHHALGAPCAGRVERACNGTVQCNGTVHTPLEVQPGNEEGNGEPVWNRMNVYGPTQACVL